MSKKLGQEPAFPLTDGKTFSNDGVSKRFYAACVVMQGILVSSTNNNVTTRQISFIVRDAYIIANELLKQENES